MKQQHVVEVSASSAPSDVVQAIVNSATKKDTPSRELQANRCFRFAFAFVIVFAIVVYFREEIYAFSTDLHKYPILSGIETVQIKQYFGTNWTFSSGDVKGDLTFDNSTLVKKVLTNVTSTVTKPPATVVKNVTAALVGSVTKPPAIGTLTKTAVVGNVTKTAMVGNMTKG